MRLAPNSTELICYRWGARGRATGRGKWSKEIRLQKEPHFPFLYTQSKLHTCVKQSWKTWHSAAGFSNQLFKLTPFCDMLLVELWKENARSCRELFLPEAWKFDSDGGKKKKKLKGFCFRYCVFPDTVYQWYIWLDLDEPQRWNYRGIWRLRMREWVWNQQTEIFHSVCSLWWNTNLSLSFSFQSMQKSRLLERITRTSLVAQWLRIRLPMQGTRVRSLVGEEPTCGATKPVRHNYWVCALEPAHLNEE